METMGQLRGLAEGLHFYIFGNRKCLSPLGEQHDTLSGFAVVMAVRMGFGMMDKELLDWFSGNHLLRNFDF